jgi:hypothetical protein
MRIRFDTTPADWEAFADFQLRHSPTLQRTVRHTRWLVAGGMLLLTAVLWFTTQSWIWLFACVVGGVWGLYDLPRTIRKSSHKQMRSMFEETFPAGSNTQGLLETREEGLYSESGRGTGMLEWSAITVFDESPSHLYLGIGGPTGVVVPKARTYEGNVAEFAAEVRRRIPAERSTSSSR